jgi:hypothetical protein
MEDSFCCKVDLETVIVDITVMKCSAIYIVYVLFRPTHVPHLFVLLYNWRSKPLDSFLQKFVISFLQWLVKWKA